MLRIFVVILTVVFGCTDSKDKIAGVWIIDKVLINDDYAVWDYYSNCFVLNKDYTCSLPISEWSDKNTSKEKGLWDLHSENGFLFIEIKTDNKLFNRTFKINEIKEVRDTISWGILMKMSLVADSVQLECSKAIY